MMATGNIGPKPNDALFHAEANALLRAAEPYGGTLAGRAIVCGWAEDCAAAAKRFSLP